METIILQKKPIFKIFQIQFGDFLALETGLLIGCYYVDLSFVIFQLLLLPIFVVILISKYTKSVTLIEIDYNNKLLRFKQNYFLISSKKYEITFNEADIKIRWKWLLNYYSQVIEINKNGKLIMVIPLIGSIWKKNELHYLLKILKSLEIKDEIKADFGSYIFDKHY